ncbi:MAG: ATP-binding protein [Planctomycetes bacterium]|nr:ATP-binding protein [Planctomycetota bacterium]
MRDAPRNQAGEPHALELDLPAAHSAVRMARAVLRRFARMEGAPAREIETMEFIASELLANAVDHGGGNQAMEEKDAGDVRMSFVAFVRTSGWEIQVGDQGGGDPEELAPFLQKDEMPDLENDRGRGFYLMAQMVTDLRVSRTRDQRGLLFTAVRVYGTNER